MQAGRVGAHLELHPLEEPLSVDADDDVWEAVLRVLLRHALPSSSSAGYHRRRERERMPTMCSKGTCLTISNGTLVPVKKASIQKGLMATSWSILESCRDRRA